MKLGILLKRAVYRDLRNSLGYYDARKIIRFIESKEETLETVEGLLQLLDELNLDQRQRTLAFNAIKTRTDALKAGRNLSDVRE